jgi:peptidoglycan hydrolase-like protein with peptidoglycan-binding domain
MTKHALRLSMALALGTSLAGMQAPATPNAATSNYTAPNTGAPNGAAPSDQQANSVSPDAVKQAQQELKDQGLYNGAIDGQFGPATRAAVQRFQQQNGLEATAMLDQETLQRLMANHHG